MAPDYVNQSVADRLVIGLVIVVALLGGYSTYRAYRQVRASRGMMGDMMMSVPGTSPIWHLLGTIVVLSLLLGIYAVVRQHAFTPASNDATGTTEDDTGEDDQEPENSDTVASSTTLATASNQSTPEVPMILPEDERRILEPVLESPGLTQVELRGRSDFSKAKVSQTVTELEERGLIYREQQGRTYRIYPGKILEQSS